MFQMLKLIPKLWNCINVTFHESFVITRGAGLPLKTSKYKGPPPYSHISFCSLNAANKGVLEPFSNKTSEDCYVNIRGLLWNQSGEVH